MPTKAQTLTAILKAPLPAVRRSDIRKTHDRKLWAKETRALLKDLGIAGLSVTAPSYSMAQSIHISMPRDDETWTGHDEAHEAARRQEYENPDGPTACQLCPYCRASQQAKHKIKAIILAAFPDLDNRSDLQSDYFDYCLSID